MARLRDKVVLIAGGGGVGDVLARRYAAEGARVVLGHRHRDAAEAVVAAIADAGGQAVAAYLDGTDEASIAAAVAMARDRFGGLDGLHVNFAALGRAREDTDVLAVSLDVVEESLRVNLLGYFLCTRLALPAIIERGGGAIVYTSSIGAHMADDRLVGYAMSKAGGHALMRHVAGTYADRGVRANAIAPGVIRPTTPARLATTAAMEAAGKRRALLKSRITEPDDIAALGILLLSDEGAYITGQVLRVDGGTTLGL